MQAFLYIAIIVSVMLSPCEAAQNTPAPDNAQEQINRGDACLSDDKVEEAIAAYQIAVKASPSSSQAHERLAKALSLNGYLVNALWEDQKAIQIDPRNALAHSNLGWVFGVQKRYREAVQEERVAIQLDPQNASSFLTLGLALASLGDYEQAAAANRAALSLDPDNLKAYVNLGATLGRKGAYAEAIEAYRKALSINANSVAAHLGLGAALGKVGKLNEQIEEFQTAVKLAPKSDGAHGKLGWALSRAGNWQGAFKEGCITNWLRLSKTGPEYLQQSLKLWGLIFLLFGLVFAVIFLGSRFKPDPGEVIIRSFFLVFYEDKPGRFIFTNKRCLFVPEAFSRWFGSQTISINRDQIENIESTTGSKGGALLITLKDASSHKFTLPQLVLKALMSEFSQASNRLASKTGQTDSQDNSIADNTTDGMND